MLTLIAFGIGCFGMGGLAVATLLWRYRPPAAPKRREYVNR